MATRSVFDELVRGRAWPLGEATGKIVETVVTAIIEPDSRSAIAEPADWSGLLRPPDAGLANG